MQVLHPHNVFNFVNFIHSLENGDTGMLNIRCSKDILFLWCFFEKMHLSVINTCNYINKVLDTVCVCLLLK